MRTFIKGILFYTTAIAVSLWIAGGFESLIENNKYLNAFIFTAIVIILCTICRYTISTRELCVITGYKLMYKLGLKE